MIGDKIKDQIISGVKSVFESDVKSPPSKKKKDTQDVLTTESAGSSETRCRSPTEVPFNDTQVKWLGRAVTNAQVAGFAAFGEAVEERVQVVENTVSAMKDVQDAWNKEADKKIEIGKLELIPDPDTGLGTCYEEREHAEFILWKNQGMKLEA